MPDRSFLPQLYLACIDSVIWPYQCVNLKRQQPVTRSDTSRIHVCINLGNSTKSVANYPAFGCGREPMSGRPSTDPAPISLRNGAAGGRVSRLAAVVAWGVSGAVRRGAAC